jgi:hypothetical protein
MAYAAIPQNSSKKLIQVLRRYIIRSPLIYRHSGQLICLRISPSLAWLRWMLKMRTRRLIAALAASALLLPTVSAAVSLAAFGFSPAVLAQMTRYGANPEQVRGLLDGMDSYIAQQARLYNIRLESLRGSLTQKVIRAPANQRTLDNAYAQVESSGNQIVVQSRSHVFRALRVLRAWALEIRCICHWSGNKSLFL